MVISSEFDHRKDAAYFKKSSENKNIFSKFQKDNIDKELVTAIRGEILPDGKWTMHAEADDVRKLIEKGAANTAKDRAGGTPLHECCHMGLVEHAKVNSIMIG